jgi:hypothetical protein
MRINFIWAAPMTGKRHLASMYPSIFANLDDCCLPRGDVFNLNPLTETDLTRIHAFAKNRVLLGSRYLPLDGCRRGQELCSFGLNPRVIWRRAIARAKRMNVTLNATMQEVYSWTTTSSSIDYILGETEWLAFDTVCNWVMIMELLRRQTIEHNP